MSVADVLPGLFRGADLLPDSAAAASEASGQEEEKKVEEEDKDKDNSNDMPVDLAGQEAHMLVVEAQLQGEVELKLKEAEDAEKQL